MLPNARRMTTVVCLAMGLALLAGEARAGVISDMIAKRRMQRQMNSQNKAVIASPFHGQGVGGGMKSPSIAGKLQKKFAIKGKGQNQGQAVPSNAVVDGTFKPFRDPNTIQTSR